MVVARGWGGERNEALLLNVYKVLVWKDEKVLEISGDDGDRTVWLNLMPLIYTHKDDYNG